MQRSGTNYLSAVLVRGGINVLNEVDPVRSNPKHKHFRWQDDKSTIRMDVAYGNELYASTIESLNLSAGFPLGTKHIVIFKEPVSWLSSIQRWAERTGWVEGSADPLAPASQQRMWLIEWQAYYEKWIELRDRSPSKVLIVEYWDFIHRPREVADRLSAFIGRSVHVPEASEISHVPHSGKRDTHTSARVEQVDAISILVEEAVTIDWRSERA